KSAVARPWERKFLGYSVTVHRETRLKIAPASVQRFKKKLRALLRQGRGRNLRGLLTELAPILRGWAAYFRLSEVKVTWESLDQWLRRKLRAILWKQWKTWRTRLRELVRLGLSRERAAASACNGRGTWWNAGASHLNEAVPNALLQRWGLVSLQQEQRRLACNV
ncbi:MAG: group II intron reverse transcriptase/maturase, partial [Phycisphaerae bacterium]|nr:group II intron reverse transcriptase/maturase [Phycisphaerae bacterium]